jgi:NhaC family Na+:H+ antiporter
MQSERHKKEVTFLHALLPILFLIVLVLYGLIIRPLFLDRDALALETIFILASFFSVSELFYLGYSWIEIQESVVNKISTALPAFFILFAIGVIISSWMVSGTIPMLVYYGLELVNPQYLYLLSFLVPVVFSSLTGTSWGSAGTIGVVLIGIATALGADLGITAGAVIGGAYFGDKMSPLSDTTNLAALATQVDLFDHIRSMMVTTVPSAFIACAGFTLLGFTHSPQVLTTDLASLTPFLESLRALFSFNVLLLIPPAIVLVGSIRKQPTIPTLLTSVFSACLLAILFQRYSLGDISTVLVDGFDASMAPWAADLPRQTAELVNRGGLYSMSQAIFVAFLVFFFIGSIDRIDAMPTVVNRVFRFAKNRPTTILSALGATAVTNAMTSNQYATSFIIGDAFKSRFDAMRIPRKVLSRSLEDTGTMLESIIPWTSTAIFMVATLGVPWTDYWHWQFMTLANLIIAPAVAILGIGCFYHEVDVEDTDEAID